MVKKSGFSLIELTVVIGLLSLLILAISSSMLMTIISSNRIRNVAKVKQAGNFALGQMQEMIRSAKTVVSCTSVDSNITILNFDGGTTNFINENNRIASNSGVYITPDNMTTSSYSVTCSPNDTDPTLVNISFDLMDSAITKKDHENPTLHFETAVSLRNQ